MKKETFELTEDEKAAFLAFIPEGPHREKLGHKVMAALERMYDEIYERYTKVRISIEANLTEEERDELKHDCICYIVTKIPKFNPTFVSSNTGKPLSIQSYFSVIIKGFMIERSTRAKKRKEMMQAMEEFNRLGLEPGVDIIGETKNPGIY